jgi:MoxR-like ATPase
MHKQIDKALLFKAGSLFFLIAGFVLSIFLMTMPLTLAPGNESFWTLAVGIGKSRTDENFFALGLVIAICLAAVPLALAVLSLLKKKTYGFFLASAYVLGLSASIIAFQAVFAHLSGGQIGVNSACLVLSLASFALVIFAQRFEKAKKGSEPAEASQAQLPPDGKKLALGVLLTDIISLLALVFSVLFVPLYTIYGNEVSSCIFAQIMVSKNPALDNSVYFLVNLLLLLTSVLLFLSVFSYYFSNQKEFIRQSRSLLAYELFVSFEFFLMGYVLQCYNTFQGNSASSLSFIPLLLLCLCTLAFSVLKGKAGLLEQSQEEKKDETPAAKKKARALRSEPLIYLLFVTLVTVGSLFLNIIKVSFTSKTYGEDIQLTGIKLLSDYASLGSGYQVLAFVLVAMLIVSGMGLVVSLAAFFSRYRHFANLAKAVTYANVFFVFLLGISGFYFSIAQEITLESTKKLIEYYNASYDASYKYSMSTDAIYALAADVIIVSVMIIRKALDGDKEALVALPAEGEKENGGEEKQTSGKKELPAEEIPSQFDPCPAFSEIDLKAPLYQEDLARRQQLHTDSVSLSGLVKFIVEYAKDSRLHLSYSEEDIAIFLAGLGSARLSILQGMSGTGKTSLPKIVAEAIDGNCELIEVESSWKDKNELLGYYNEFTSTYTPKKFTQALYKAALNPEIPTFIVLDEMNLSRIEYYFSDFLSLMENEEGKREIKLLNVPLFRREADGSHPYLALSEGHTLKIPANVWFIGTANRDESTFVISDKVYDRAHTMNFNKRAPKVRNFSAPLPQRFYTYKDLASLFQEALDKGHFDAENSQTIRQAEMLLAPYNISFGNRILKQIEEFVDIYEACFPGQESENAAVEEILLSKVVAKLEVKTIENKEDLAKEFENLHLLKCADFISKLNED